MEDSGLYCSVGTPPDLDVLLPPLLLPQEEERREGGGWEAGEGTGTPTIPHGPYLPTLPPPIPGPVVDGGKDSSGVRTDSDRIPRELALAIPSLPRVCLLRKEEEGSVFFCIPPTPTAPVSLQPAPIPDRNIGYYSSGGKFIVDHPYYNLFPFPTYSPEYQEKREKRQEGRRRERRRRKKEGGGGEGGEKGGWN